MKKKWILTKKVIFEMRFASLLGSKFDPARARAKHQNYFFPNFISLLSIHNIIIALLYGFCAINVFLSISPLFCSKTMILADFCTPPPKIWKKFKIFKTFFFWIIIILFFFRYVFIVLIHKYGLFRLLTYLPLQDPKMRVHFAAIFSHFSKLTSRFWNVPYKRTKIIIFVSNFCFVSKVLRNQFWSHSDH